MRRVAPRIGFFDGVGWDYTIASPYAGPLGGSQSALCYLAEQLASRGRCVSLFNGTTRSARVRGVDCVPLAEASGAQLRELDVAILLNDPSHGTALRRQLRPSTPIALWLHNDTSHFAMAALRRAATARLFDAFVFVSEWQRERFRAEYGLEAARCHVIGNAVGPAFLEAGGLGAPRQPILAYTSTPFRGLEALLAIFPYVRAVIPQARLRVFSSMEVYRKSAEFDEAHYGALYERCRSTPGVQYRGSLAQPDLARELQTVRIWAYPTQFPETFCIAMCEALALGCRVVASRLAALPETASGHAALVPVGAGGADLNAFTGELIRHLSEPDAPHREQALRRQVEYVRRTHCWGVRAERWERLVDGLARRPAPRGLDRPRCAPEIG